MLSRILTLLAVFSLASTASPAFAQPILNRVEQFVRDQVDAVRDVAQPPANTAQPPANTATPANVANEPGYLGLVADQSANPPTGVRVMEVRPGGPAAQGGVQVGDRILAVDGRPVRTMDDFAQALDGKTVGTRLAITVERNAASRQQQVVLGRRLPQGPAIPAAETVATPDAAQGGSVPPGPRLGIRTLPVTEETRLANNLPQSRGATVIAITPGLPAERAGIPLGAVITAVDQLPVDSPDGLAKAVSAAGSEIELTYYQQGREIRQRVALVAANDPAGVPKLELRGRPAAQTPAAQTPAAQRPAPSDEPAPPTPAPPIPSPPDASTPDTSNAAERIVALESKVRELEARIEKLEQSLSERTDK